jgi:hypothetical protein
MMHYVCTLVLTWGWMLRIDCTDQIVKCEVTDQTGQIYVSAHGLDEDTKDIGPAMCALVKVLHVCDFLNMPITPVDILAIHCGPDVTQQNVCTVIGVVPQAYTIRNLSTSLTLQ